MDEQAVVQPPQDGGMANGGGMFPQQQYFWAQGGVPPPQHRPEMPSTSSGASLPFCEVQNPSGYFSPSMGPPCGVPGTPTGFYGQPQPPFYGGQMPPMGGCPPGVNGDFQAPPPYNPQMGRGAPPPAARQSPFPGPQHPPLMSRASNPQMLPRQTSSSYVFTSEMINTAVSEVRKNAYQSIVHWHESAGKAAFQRTQQNMVMVENGQRNSPSYPPSQAPSARSLKRKNTSQSEQQNPTPSPQMPGSAPEFRQPMSNQPPGSVPEFPVKQENIKTEMLTPTDENNPLKKMEIMASFSNEPAAKALKPNNGTKEEKMAKLDEIDRCLKQPNYPTGPNGVPPGAYPPGPAFAGGPGMPPHFMNGQGYGMPPGFQPGAPFPNGMPPGADQGQMGAAPFPPQMHGGMMMQNGGFMPGQGGMPNMNSPRYMGQPPMGPGMMGMMANGRPAPYPPPQMDYMARGMPADYSWQQGVPQPLTNLDSRVPSQKMQYYGNSQPPMGGPMPPPANSTT